MPRYRLVLTGHAEQRMIEYDISLNDLRQVIDEGDVLRHYPEDRPYESCSCWGSRRNVRFMW